MVKNYGISFGINGTFFIILSIIFVLLFLVLAIKNGRGYWFIFIGGVANLIERMVFGYVRDY